MNQSIEAPIEDQARPVSAKERILTLDVLRGFALFGIMFVNVYAFVHPAQWFTVNWDEIGAAESAFEVFKMAFTQGKFYSLFAFLFGLGFSVQLASAERKGAPVSFVFRFFWRLMILYGIAAVHFIFIWGGDILNSYAAGGMILLLTYVLKRAIEFAVQKVAKRPQFKIPRGMMLVSAFLLMCVPLLGWGGYIYQQESLIARYEAKEQLTDQEQKRVERILEFRKPEAQQKRREHQREINDTFTLGSYADVVDYRLGILQERFWETKGFWYTVCGLFLIGAFFGRYNFIGRAAEFRSGFVKLGIASFIVGAVFNIGFIYTVLARPENAGQVWNWANFSLKTFAGISWALMFVAVISLAMLGNAKNYLKVFAPVGQMALTNYLTQSLIGATVFYGYGLGLVGKLNAFEQFGYMVVLFAAQVKFSQWWLSRYRFGPMEWLWRSLTYLRLQPMKIEPPATASATLA